MSVPITRLVSALMLRPKEGIADARTQTGTEHRGMRLTAAPGALEAARGLRQHGGRRRSAQLHGHGAEVGVVRQHLQHLPAGELMLTRMLAMHQLCKKITTSCRELQIGDER